MDSIFSPDKLVVYISSTPNQNYYFQKNNIWKVAQSPQNTFFKFRRIKLRQLISGYETSRAKLLYEKVKIKCRPYLYQNVSWI